MGQAKRRGTYEQRKAEGEQKLIAAEKQRIVDAENAARIRKEREIERIEAVGRRIGLSSTYRANLVASLLLDNVNSVGVYNKR